MTQYDDIVVTPVYGPRSTNQYPNAMPRHNLGTLSGIHPNPPLFYPSQEPVNSDQFTTSRHIYARTAQSNLSFALKREKAIQSPSLAYYSYSSNMYKPITTHCNYIAPQDSSLYLQRKKAMAVGKSSYKVGLPVEANYTTKNVYTSGVRSSLRRARSGGCTAPKKKGALENGQVCSWGALPRQTY